MALASSRGASASARSGAWTRFDFATAWLASAQQLTDRVVDAVGEPVLAALLLGEAATANAA